MRAHVMGENTNNDVVFEFKKNTFFFIEVSTLSNFKLCPASAELFINLLYVLDVSVMY